MIPLFALALFGAGILVNIWVGWTLKRHMHPASFVRGTGGQLASHLLQTANLDAVKLKTGKEPDHYDPINKHIHLSPEIFETKSLSAVVVAAHEFGHALQDAQGYKPLRLRTKLAPLLVPLDFISNMALIVAPAISLFSGAGVGFKIFLVMALFPVFAKVFFHLITLPVEFDASFNKALPLLESGGYLPSEAMPAARQILRAAALTYVAGAVGSIFNIFFWLRILR